MTQTLRLDIPALAPALQAAAVLAVDPLALGGAVVRGDAVSAQGWAELVVGLSARLGAVRRLPLSITLDRLCGGLDLAGTLQRGRPIMQRGVIAEADGGWLVAPSAERLEAGVTAEICAALDKGFTELARDGLSRRSPARFAVLALDDGRDAEELAPAALCERLALHVELDPAAPNAAPDGLAAQVALARGRLAQVVLSQPARRALCGAAMAVGEPSLRAARFCTHVARILAALAGRSRVGREDIAAAAALVLASRARHLPQASSEPQEAASQDPAPQEPGHEPPANTAHPPPADSSPPLPGADTSSAETDPSRSQAQPPRSDPTLEDLSIAAVRAATPDGVFSSGSADTAASGAGGGRVRGRPMRGRVTERGAPAGVRRAASGATRRLALIDTLKAAAPWQGLRASSALQPSLASSTASRLQVRPADFRVRVRRPPQRGSVVFVVDASGSAAVQRLAEAKGAVELLLADCYARRDQVALVSFRQTSAEVVLPPTRSLTRVRRRLGELAAGGGTPLASAIQAGGKLACAARARGEQPLLVFMTDARANVARSGEQGRAIGAADAMAAGRELAGLKLDSVFIDISPRGEAQAGAVAEAMGARYLRLPHVQAEGLAQTVRAARRTLAGPAGSAR